jgi:Cu(I)/Ag(I) efflux system membrane fusion protein
VKRAAWLVLILAAMSAAGVGGYRIGRNGPVSLSIAASAAGRGDSPAIYYQDPEGKPIYAAAPRSTPDGRPYRAVHANEDISFDSNGTVKPNSAVEASAGRKILYYRNPMGLPDISKVPKKDSMGMDYIPVYEGEDTDSTTVKVSAGKLQRIGVKTEPAALRVIAEPVRAPGTIQLDERRIAVVSLRAEAFVETVENVTTGSAVRKGQPLLKIYSPAITGAGAEFAMGLNANDPKMVAGVRQRLLNLGAPVQLLTEVERTHAIPLAFTLPAPRDSLVLERNVVDGQRLMPGDVMFRLADESVVWALVDVAERDLAAIKEGQAVKVRVRGFPDRTFAGTVSLIYPYLNPATRTVRVRIELANPNLVLKPDMYAEAEIDAGGRDAVLAVPDNAVIDSGDRQLVLIDQGDGRFEPRPVQLGRRGAGYVQVRDGLQKGQVVVTSANFLIDAESNLKSALQSLTSAEAAQ